MATKDKPNINQAELVRRWTEELPRHLKNQDAIEVLADQANPTRLLVSIVSDRREKFEFDFIIQYMDSREIKIELADFERAGKEANERHDTVQELIAEYRRSMHECAQALQAYTHT